MRRRASELLKVEHAHLGAELEEHGRALLGRLDAERMHRIVTWLEEAVLPHDEWEEHVLFPAIDKHTGTGVHPFTATLRHEHRIILRWTRELHDLASAARADAPVFARRAERLFGLLEAHTEAEEIVLSQVLGLSLTDAEFEREVVARMTTYPLP